MKSFATVLIGLVLLVGCSVPTPVGVDSSMASQLEAIQRDTVGVDFKVEWIKKATLVEFDELNESLHARQQAGEQLYVAKVRFDPSTFGIPFDYRVFTEDLSEVCYVSEWQFEVK